MTKFKGGRPKSLTLFIPWKEYLRWNYLCLFVQTSTIYILCLFAWDESIIPRILEYFLQLIYNWTCLVGFLMYFSYGSPPTFNSSVLSYISPTDFSPTETSPKDRYQTYFEKWYYKSIYLLIDSLRDHSRFQSFGYISLITFKKFLLQ